MVMLTGSRLHPTPKNPLDKSGSRQERKTFLPAGFSPSRIFEYFGFRIRFHKKRPKYSFFPIWTFELKSCSVYEGMTRSLSANFKPIAKLSRATTAASLIHSPLSIASKVTSKVPPPRSNTRMFSSTPSLSRPYAIAAAVGSLITRSTCKA